MMLNTTTNSALVGYLNVTLLYTASRYQSAMMMLTL